VVEGIGEFPFALSLSKRGKTFFNGLMTIA
jgi:hypothetical protein